jgi:hypothetical protein
MTPHYVNQGGELNWLLDDLVDRVPEGADGAPVDGAFVNGAPVDATAAAAPQPRDVPSAGSVYSPYPKTAGQSDPAPYAE